MKINFDRNAEKRRETKEELEAGLSNDSLADNEINENYDNFALAGHDRVEEFMNEVQELELDNEIEDYESYINEESDENREALSEIEQIKEISDFIDSLDEINFENWKDLEINERIVVMQNIEKKIAEITNRSPLQVELERMPSGVRGAMDWEKQKILMNQDLVSSESINDLHHALTTLNHESRHGYQMYNLLISRTELNVEKYEEWRKNVMEPPGYINAGLFGFKRYYMQPIEVDARDFSEAVMNNVKLRGK